jgi:flagellar motor switch protein FliG
MSARAAQLLKEDMDIMGPVNYERSVNSIQKIGTILSNLYSKNEIKYIDKALWTQYVDTKDPDLQYLKRFPEKIRKETSFTLLRTYFEYLNELNNINEQADKKKTELFNSITNSFSSELIKKTNEAVLAKYAFKGTNRELRNIYFKQSDIPLKELSMIFHKYLTDFNIIEQMDDRFIQFLLRKIDFNVLAKALSLAHYNIQNKILCNFSKKEGENLKMRINSNRNIPLEEAFTAQSEIADYIILLGKDNCTGIHYP